MLTLTWIARPSLARRNRKAYELRGDGIISGTAFKCGDRYTATVNVLLPNDRGGTSRYTSGGTLHSAMRNLERILDRESIGLFGVDDIAFQVQEMGEEPKPC